MRVYKPSYTKTLPEEAKILKHKDGKFAKFKDNQQVRRRLKCYTNKQATERLADRIQTLMDYKASNTPLDTELQKFFEQLPSKIRDELISFEILDANRTAAGKTLLELLGEFQQSMQAKERTPKHIRETVKMVKCIFEGCRFKFWSDILSTKVESYLKDLRDEGISYRRSNGYLTAIKSFCEWMVKSSYASASPLKHLAKLNPELDRRRERRAATEDELRQLLETTRRGPNRFGLTGYERSLVYWLAAETGLRKTELRTLKVSSFNFENTTVTVDSGYSKHREQDTLPLNADLAAELKEYFSNKPTAEVDNRKIKTLKAFRITDKTCDMLKADLADAGIPYIKDGKYYDLHAMRHSFITNLKNVPSRIAQSLARHKSSTMTDLYTHIELHDERAAIETLPDLKPNRQKQQAKMTGTDGNFLPISCFHDAQMRTNTDCRGKSTAIQTPKQRFERARQDSNLQPSDSKSATSNTQVFKNQRLAKFQKSS